MTLLAEKIKVCTDCRLHEDRRNAVPGEGNKDSNIMLIGEAPGKNEDLEGRPFVGRAGELLEELLGKAGLDRDEVFITNVVKCRPPDNRDPRKDEIKTCNPYLEKQIEFIEPDVIVTLGNHATETLIGKTGMKKIHGKRFEYDDLEMIPMYHPAAGLYNPGLKETMEEDMQRLTDHL
ncbi:MAG: uracil-DNA glycosylase family protein [Candidatus Natronoplasma sp.]